MRLSEDMQVCEASGIIRELRQRGLLFPAGEIRTRAAVVSSGIAKLDSLCGGLPAGGITEILVPGSGAAGILYALLAAATSRGESAAVIDPRDGFEASSATSACVNLQRLLWVRARGRRQALHACEIALASGAFGMVVLDMGPGRGRGPVSTAAWMRIRNLARTTGAVVPVISTLSMAGPFASLALRVSGSVSRWRGKSRADKLFEGMELSFEVTRKRGV
ncbi:MAG TPA: hypothetical protein VM425_00590 [Myxococcota bacterium]|nr:hypothetical protein [Myxococcota bacterium]